MSLAIKQDSLVFDQEKTGVADRSPGFFTAILGLGNRIRGDDGVGCAVVDLLMQTRDLPEYVHLFENGTGDLFDAIFSNKYERVILIDAAEINRQPGEWICLNADRLTWKADDKDHSCNGHWLSLVNMLALGHALHALPRELLVYAVQPMAIEWTGTLSEPVREAVSEISESILREIREYS
jgi:hydrogenase maturation protease